jgi:transposase-like protein
MGMAETDTEIMTNKQRDAEFQRKKCAECDRMANALTFTPTKVIRRCVAHWVAYYRRREGMA